MLDWFIDPDETEPDYEDYMEEPDDEECWACLTDEDYDEGSYYEPKDY